MRTRTCFWLRILHVIVCTCSGSLFCQDPLNYVPNAPYTALKEQKYPEVLADGTRVQRERKIVEMRDSQGRTRIEIFPPDRSYCCRDDKPDGVNLYLPLQRQFIQLFPGRKIASVFTFPGTGPIPRHLDSNGKSTKRESLPGKTIHGIYSEGTRITFNVHHDDGRGGEVGCVEETWVSPEMKIAVLTNYGGTCGDGGITEIRELDRREPDATLFEIPTGYKVIVQPSN